MKCPNCLISKEEMMLIDDDGVWECPNCQLIINTLNMHPEEKEYFENKNK